MAWQPQLSRHCYSLLSLFSLCTLLTLKPAAGENWHAGGARTFSDRRIAKTATQNWLNHGGGDLYNRRHAVNETKISPKTASTLRFKWKFNAGFDITATPAIFDGTLYFPSWNGYLYAVNSSDGSLIWEKNLQALTGLKPTGFIAGVNWTVSRATPTVVGDGLLVVGIYGPAVVIALERSTGNLAWSTLLDSHPASTVTMSGTYYKGSYYIGTSSLEEFVDPKECCTFRGSLNKLDAKSGAILWKTYMLPDNKGKLGQYAGAALWGSSPSIDVHKKHVYIATGNIYAVPKNISQCQENQNNNSTIPTQPDACVEPVNHGNSILALDLDSGNIQWYRQLGGYDVWYFACLLNVADCPTGPNVDADFGEAPMVLTPYVNGTKRDVVVSVQKSGFAWALDRSNGSLVWSMEAGPGGVVGGGTWGAATDKKRVYTNIVNNDRKNFTLKPSTNVSTSGGWVAMDPGSGKILWSTADPSNGTTPGPVSVANGVLFAGSASTQGTVYAMDTSTGKILWSYDTGSSVYGGMSISNGCIYVGSGYSVGVGVILGFTAGTSLFAFCIAA